MTHKEIKVSLSFGEIYIIDGHGYCYKTEGAALRTSARVTTLPGVVELIWGGRRLYLAVGDSYIDGSGTEGQYLYGKRGILVSLVVV